MAQFDVYKNLNKSTHSSIPFLMDIQADILANLSTRMVVPLYSASIISSPAKYLNPKFSINQQEVIMSISEMVGIPVILLDEPLVNLAEEFEEVFTALDFLFKGI